MANLDDGIDTIKARSTLFALMTAKLEDAHVIAVKGQSRDLDAANAKGCITDIRSILDELQIQLNAAELISLVRLAFAKTPKAAIGPLSDRQLCDRAGSETDFCSTILQATASDPQAAIPKPVRSDDHNRSLIQKVQKQADPIKVRSYKNSIHRPDRSRHLMLSARSKNKHCAGGVHRFVPYSHYNETKTLTYFMQPI